MYPRSKELIEKPNNLEDMNKVASAIASSLKDKMNFSRIDLYNVNGKVLFGEITFHPGGGCEPFSDYKYDVELGKMISSD